MAKYATSAEAQKDIVDQLAKKRLEWTTVAYSEKPEDKKRTKELLADIKKLENQYGMTTPSGAFESGLLSGATSLLTAIPDIAIAGYNWLRKSGAPEVKPLQERLLPGVESVSKEEAGWFGLGKGIGSSTIPLGKVLTVLNVGTNVTDEVVFDGVPLTQLLTGVGLLTKAGYQGAKNWRENSQTKKLLEQIGPENANTLREFMLKGQDSADPRVAGIIAKLRSNPEYAEMFNVLEKKASEAARKGMRSEVNPNYPVDKTGQAIYQAVDGEVLKLRNAIKTDGSGAFRKAYELAGDSEIVSTTNTKDAIAKMIGEYSAKQTDDAKNTVAFLQRFQDSISNVPFEKKLTVPQLQGLLSEWGKDAAKGESLLTNISVDTQQKIASAIFGGLKDDLKVLASSNKADEKAVGNLLQSARESTRKAVVNYNDFTAQGLPKILRNKTIGEIDTTELINAVKELSPAQKGRLASVLENTAPEDLKRIKQVIYDDFTQKARTVLPDNTTGIDLKLLATKYNTLNETDKANVAFALGANADDFGQRMKDAENFFKYQQKFGGTGPAQGFTAAELAEMSSAGYLAGSYTSGKTIGLLGRFYNSIKGGLTDEQTMAFLMSPETKDLLKGTLSPNGEKVLEGITVTLGSRPSKTTLGGATFMGAKGLQQTIPSEPVQRDLWDIGPAQAGEPTAPMEETEKESWDIGPRSSLNPAQIKEKIAEEANKQGLGQFTDLFLKQAMAESNYDPYAVSKVGASGVFQLMPGTAKDLGVTDVFDAEQNISGGIKYMGQLLNRYQDPTVALAAYNWGMGNVDRQGMANMPEETRNYLAKIL